MSNRRLAARATSQRGRSHMRWQGTPTPIKADQCRRWAHNATHRDAVLASHVRRHYRSGACAPPATAPLLSRRSSGTESAGPSFVRHAIINVTVGSRDTASGQSAE